VFLSPAVLAEDQPQSGLAVKETKYYRFLVPSNWREMDLRGYGPTFHFEASGRAYPPMYKDGPLILNIAVIEVDVKSLESAKDSLLRTFSNYHDRVWEKNYKHTIKKIKLKSGHKAYYLATRFYRTTKHLYQNRYELVTYSDRKKGAIVLSTSIQHGDKTFAVAEELDFYGKIVKPLHSSFEIK